ncbi:hypothetical protein JR338_04525 [Chloroflexota bacterium]|nr:hypothetical protein JR338_04525 [Chloroflexota bacterium]
MESTMLRIETYEGEGYRPLVDFGNWRVAYLRFIDELIPENITQMEKHLETDEVFVLLNGEAVLFIGEGENLLGRVSCLKMEPHKVYVVEKATWHTCVLDLDATILLVENQDTGLANTEYIDIDVSTKKYIVENSKTLISG